jgi:hypothetical protein
MSGLTARHGRDDHWGGTGGTAPCGHEARQKETMMMAFAAMAPERLAFLSELYTRSAGDARQGVPYVLRLALIERSARNRASFPAHNH